MLDENEVLKRLVVDEKDVIKILEKHVEEALKYFSIEKPSGRVIFQNFGALTDKKRIAIILLGKYFACKLKLIEDPSLSITDISRELGRPMTTLSKSLGDLVDKGYVEYLSGKKYRISYNRIKEIFDDISQEKRKNKS